MATQKSRSFGPGLKPLFIFASILLASLTATGCYTHMPYRYDDSDYYHDDYYYGYDDAPYSYVTSEYYFYPDHHVYYDIHRHVYYYNHIHHGWIGVSVLPKHILLNHHHRQKLKLHQHQPWKKHKIKNVRRHHDKMHTGNPADGRIKQHSRKQNKAALIHEQRINQGKASSHIKTDRERAAISNREPARHNPLVQRVKKDTGKNKRTAIRDEASRQNNDAKKMTANAQQDMGSGKRLRRQAMMTDDRNQREPVAHNRRAQSSTTKNDEATSIVRNRPGRQKIERQPKNDDKKQAVAETRRKKQRAANDNRSSWRNRHAPGQADTTRAYRFQQGAGRSPSLDRKE
jgi:hypothetical protein